MAEAFVHELEAVDDDAVGRAETDAEQVAEGLLQPEARDHKMIKTFSPWTFINLNSKSVFPVDFYKFEFQKRFSIGFFLAS